MGQEYDEDAEKYEYYQHLVDTEQVPTRYIDVVEKVLAANELSHDEQKSFALFESEQQKSCIRCGAEVEWSSRIIEENECCDYCMNQAEKA